MDRGVLALGVVALLALLGLGDAKNQPPKVEVYARSRPVEGQGNILQCHVTGFSPEDILVELLKNGEPMTDVTYGDLSLDEKRQFQRLVSAPFTPSRDDVFTCRVIHVALEEGTQTYRW
ncbi:B2MG protein, partial [Serilophus lunatus]|nr:B2MG protein [Serilophus lunatus]